MLTIYFGNDDEKNKAIKERLKLLKLEYQEYQSKDINLQILMNLIVNTPDMFDLLSPKMMRYKLDNRLRLSEFSLKILKDIDNSLKFPIVIHNNIIYPGMSVEELGLFIPSSYRRSERIHLYHQLEQLNVERRFWRNFKILRERSELRWHEFNHLMFADVSDDLGEVKKAKDRFFSYKDNKQIPPKEIIEKMAMILMISEDEFFQHSPSDLQNF